jgi:hypothetical protein
MQGAFGGENMQMRSDWPRKRSTIHDEQEGTIGISNMAERRDRMG